MQLLDLTTSALFLAGIAVVIVVAVFVAVSRRMYSARTVIRQGMLVIDYGRYGRVLIPLGSIVSVKRVRDPGRGVRLTGISIPGRVYLGSFYFKDLGTVFMASDRPRDLVLLELSDSRRVLLGYNTDKLYDLIKKEAGQGPRGSLRIEANARLIKYSIPLYAAALVLLAAVIALLPERFMLLGSIWSRSEGIIVATIFTILHLSDMLLLYALSREVPSLQLLVPASAASSLLVTASILLAGITHPLQ